MPGHAANKSYGTVSADMQKAMSGLEFIQGLVDGTLPLNTIAETLGYDVTEAERGRVVVEATPNGTHLNPAGMVHGGLAATLLDSCMGLAVQSLLEKGIGRTTVEFKISLVQPITPETGPIKAEGFVLNCGRRIATAVGRRNGRQVSGLQRPHRRAVSCQARHERCWQSAPNPRGPARAFRGCMRRPL